MEQNNIKWGSVTPKYFKDWSHTTVNQMTGNEEPLNLAFTAFGIYSFEIKNEEIFNEKIKYDENNVRNVFLTYFEQYINNLNKEDSTLDSINNLVNKNTITENLFKYINEKTLEGYGFVFTQIDIKRITLDEESNKKLEEYKNTNTNINSNSDNNTSTDLTQNSIYQQRNVIIEDKNSENIFLAIGVIVILVIIISIISIFIIHKKRKD